MVDDKTKAQVAAKVKEATDRIQRAEKIAAAFKGAEMARKVAKQQKDQ